MREFVAFLFMIFLNFLIFSSQNAVNELAAISGDTAPTFSFASEYMESFNAGNYTLNEDYASQLPVSDAGVISQLGAYLFPLQVFLNWLTSFPLVILAFLTALPNFLIAMGVTPVLSWAIGFIWISAGTLLLIFAILK